MSKRGKAKSPSPLVVFGPDPGFSGGVGVGDPESQVSPCIIEQQCTTFHASNSCGETPFESGLNAHPNNMNPKISNNTIRLRGSTIAVACLSVISAQLGAEVTPGYDLYIDARQDTDGDLQAEDLTSGNPSGLELRIDDAPLVSRVATSTGTKLTEAYDLPGGAINNEGGLLLVQTGTSNQRSFQEAANPSDWSNKPVSLEIWFKPDNLTPTPGNGQILFEDGGGTGLGLFIRNNELLLSNDGNQSQISYNLATDPQAILLDAATAEFIHVVATHDAGASNECQLFINGTLIGSSIDDGDWSGGDAAGFGTRGDANVGGYGGGQQNTETLDGQIALVRVYQGQILTLAEVQANFDEDKEPIPNATKIELAGDGTITVERATEFVDPGVAEVIDVDQGTAIAGAEAEVTIDDSALDLNTAGTYVIQYSYDATEPLVDSTITRTVIVEDTKAPVVQLIGDATIVIPAGGTFVDPGATAADAIDDAETPVYSGAGGPAPSDATGIWTFDDDTIDDSSGNGYNGLPVGTMTFSTDTPFGSGKSIDFSGGNNAFYVDDGTLDQTVFEPTSFLRAPSPNDPILVEQWTVESTGVGVLVDAGTADFVATSAEIDAAVASNGATAVSQWDNVNFGDGNTGRIGSDSLYPGAFDNNPDNIAIRATGVLRIPVDGDYDIGFQSDDGSSLVIENTNATFQQPLLESVGGGRVIQKLETPAVVDNLGSLGEDGDLSNAPLSSDPFLDGGDASPLFEQAGALVEPTVPEPGVSNHSLLFSGEHLDAPFNAAFNVADADVAAATGIAGAASEITVEFWAKPSANGNLVCPINNLVFDGSARKGWLFYQTPDDSWEWRVGDDTGYIEPVRGNPGAFPNTYDQWNHVVGVLRLDKTDPANPVYTAELYIDGALSNSVVQSRIPLINDFVTVDSVPGKVRVGATNQSIELAPGRQFLGNLDEIAVYASALSPAQIQAHFENGANVPARTMAYPDAIGADSPLVYWRGEDSQPEIADTLTGLFAPANGGSQTAVGRITLTAGDYPIKFISRERGGGEYCEVFAKRAESETFDPLSYGDFPGYPSETPLTISFFAKRVGWNGNWSAMVTKRGEGGQGWQVRRRASSDKVTFTTRGLGNDDPDQGSITTVPNGQWHHIVAEYGGSGGNRKLWVDGVLDFDVTSNGFLNKAPGFNFAVGALDNDPTEGPNLTNYFQGMIDNVGVYHRSLTEAERFALLAGGGNFDTNAPGTYTINYVSIDPSGNVGVASRQVVVGPPIPLVVTGLENQEDGSVDVTWSSVPNVSYTVSVSLDLETWQDVTTGLASAGESTTFNYAGGPGLPDPDLRVTPKLFFRVTKE